MTTDYIIVTTTTDTRDRARDMARALVEQKLAACVEIQNVDSIYSWKNEICDTTEYVLIIKTRAALYPELEQTIKSLHTYELPQIIALPITNGLPGYLQWLNDETK